MLTTISTSTTPKSGGENMAPTHDNNNNNNDDDDSDVGGPPPPVSPEVTQFHEVVHNMIKYATTKQNLTDVVVAYYAPPASSTNHGFIIRNKREFAKRGGMMETFFGYVNYSSFTKLRLTSFGGFECAEYDGLHLNTNTVTFLHPSFIPRVVSYDGNPLLVQQIMTARQVLKTKAAAVTKKTSMLQQEPTTERDNMIHNMTQGVTAGAAAASAASKVSEVPVDFLDTECMPPNKRQKTTQGPTNLPPPPPPLPSAAKTAVAIPPPGKRLPSERESESSAGIASFPTVSVIQPIPHRISSSETAARTAQARTSKMTATASKAETSDVSERTSSRSAMLLPSNTQHDPPPNNKRKFSSKTSEFVSASSSSSNSTREINIESFSNLDDKIQKMTQMTEQLRDGMKSISHERDKEICSLKAAHKDEVTKLRTQLGDHREEMNKLRASNDNDKVARLQQYLQEHWNEIDRLRATNARLEKDLFQACRDREKAIREKELIQKRQCIVDNNTREDVSKTFQEQQLEKQLKELVRLREAVRRQKLELNGATSATNDKLHEQLERQREELIKLRVNLSVMQIERDTARKAAATVEAEKAAGNTELNAWIEKYKKLQKHTTDVHEKYQSVVSERDDLRKRLAADL